MIINSDEMKIKATILSGILANPDFRAEAHAWFNSGERKNSPLDYYIDMTNVLFEKLKTK
jgi:hypothetical protein